MKNKGIRGLASLVFGAVAISGCTPPPPPPTQADPGVRLMDVYCEDAAGQKVKVESGLLNSQYQEYGDVLDYSDRRGYEVTKPDGTTVQYNHEKCGFKTYFVK